MLIKTVDTVITTNSAGQTVESLPVREVVDGETDIVGRPVTVIPVTEDANGVPVRFVTGKSVLNSAGQLVDTTPVKGGGIDYIDQILGAGGLDYALFDFRKTDRLSQDGGFTVPVVNNSDPIGLAIGAERQGNKTFAQSIASFTLTDVLTNGNFNAGSTGWTVTNADGTHIVTFSGGAMRYQSDTTTPVLGVAQAGVLSLNGLYRSTSVCLLTTTVGIKADAVTGSVALHGTVSGSYERFWPAISTAFTMLRNGSPVDVTLDSIKLEKVPLHWAGQATASFKPQLQAAGAKFDGSDDNLLTDWLMQAGANCMLLQVSVPATLSTALAVAGTRDTATSGLFWVGIGASGTVNMAIGSNAATLAAINTRGTDVIIGLSCDGTTVKGFVNNAETYSASQAGAPSTTVPIRLGALNNNGVAASFWPGSIRRVAFGKKALTLAEFQQIRSQWLAAA